ncbi:hypothetical protein TNCT_130751 [Trichonephila clavata]|uniref:Uncharacterized protein n=1 Tax=Trichonephila clavata TaxID=2740835 RepID=A0A8X6HN79_TRICU|nr:hypothetical protein TNCT_130751 [Trichonephila clavata]
MSEKEKKVREKKVCGTTYEKREECEKDKVSSVRALLSVGEQRSLFSKLQNVCLRKRMYRALSKEREKGESTIQNRNKTK